MTGLLGFLIVIVIVIVIRQLSFSKAPARAVIDLPDFAAIANARARAKSRADWSGYSKISGEIAKLKQGWSLEERYFSKKPIAEFEQKISEESLLTQTSQIKQLFAEEETFRKTALAKSVALYRQKLQLEAERELEIKTAGLTNSFANEVGHQELDLKNVVEDYHAKLVNDYQVTLANLQLQLLLVDLSGDVKDPAGEKQKIQNQIEKIHQEMGDKVTVKQRQLAAGLEEFKQQRLLALNLEIAGLKVQLAATVEAELENYYKQLEADFNKWRQQRAREIQMVIDLR